MSRRKVQISVFAFIAMVAVPLAVMLEIGTIDLGHELTWRLFGGLSQAHSAWLRLTLVAVAIASIICALAYRGRRSET
jgi:hypothetical protein